MKTKLLPLSAAILLAISTAHGASADEDAVIITDAVATIDPVSYTHLTLPTIYSV